MLNFCLGKKKYLKSCSGLVLLPPCTAPSPSCTTSTRSSVYPQGMGNFQEVFKCLHCHLKFCPPGLKWIAGVSLEIGRWPADEKKQAGPGEWARQSWTSHSPAKRSFISYVGNPLKTIIKQAIIKYLICKERKQFMIFSAGRARQIKCRNGQKFAVSLTLWSTSDFCYRLEKKTQNIWCLMWCH